MSIQESGHGKEKTEYTTQIAAGNNIYERANSPLSRSKLKNVDLGEGFRALFLREEWAVFAPWSRLPVTHLPMYVDSDLILATPVALRLESENKDVTVECTLGDTTFVLLGFVGVQKSFCNNSYDKLRLANLDQERYMESLDKILNFEYYEHALPALKCTVYFEVLER